MKEMKKKIFLISILAALVLALLAGCSSTPTATEEESKPADDQSAATEAVDTEAEVEETSEAEPVKDTFSFANPYEITNLDPNVTAGTWDAMMVLNTHDPLVRMDASGAVVPALAERWEAAEDGMSYTFYLRDDVKFQDGSDLKASDIKFSIERAMSKPSSKRFTAPFESVEVVNDYEVILHLKYPSAATLKYLTQANNAIVSEKIINEVGEDVYKTDPCGTGPFQLSEWLPGDRLILTAFEDYYLGAPKIKTLTYRVITEPTTALVALETGDIDAILNVSAVNLMTIESNPDFTVLKTAGTAYWHLPMNNQIPPFDNVLVRKAIAMGVDRQEIIDVALDGAGVVAEIPVHFNSTGYTDEVKRAAYDPEGAKELLAEAGYPDGFSTQLYVREDFTQKVGQVLQAQLEKIGVTVEVVVMERSAMLADADEGKLPIATFGAGDLILDAAIPLNALNSESWGAGSNYSFYSNPEYDRLNALQAVEQDPVKRDELIKQALQLEIDESPRTPLFWQTANIVFNKDIKNMEVYASNLYFWYNLSW